MEEQPTPSPQPDIFTNVARSLAALGGLLLGIATWIHGGDGRDALGDTQGVTIAAIALAAIGLLLFRPLIRESALYFGGADPRRRLGIAAGWIALLVVGSFLGLNIQAWLKPQIFTVRATRLEPGQDDDQPRRQVTQEELRTRRSFEDVELRLSALDDVRVLAGKSFFDCTVRGPGALIFEGRTRLTGNHFHYDSKIAPLEQWINGMVWEIDGKAEISGAFSAADTTFDNCSFREIVIAGPVGIKERLTSSFQVRPAPAQP